MLHHPRFTNVTRRLVLSKLVRLHRSGVIVEEARIGTSIDGKRPAICQLMFSDRRLPGGSAHAIAINRGAGKAVLRVYDVRGNGLQQRDVHGHKASGRQQYLY